MTDKKLIRTLLCGASFAAMGLSFGTAANARVAEADGTESSANEIIVTARRSEESIQSVPVSVSAFSGEALREASIRTVQDLQYSVSGVTLQGANARENATYFIRGQGKAPIGPGSPAVLAYFAEVPLNLYGSGGLAYDLSDVQVLKGPQGTLFGRNTTGGAILFTPAAPTDEVEGYIQGTYGNYDYMDLEAAVNLPIAGDLAALRVAGRLSRRDGYTKNLGADGPMDDTHSDQIRVSLRVNPADWLTNTTIFDYRHIDANTSGAVLVNARPIGVGFIDALTEGALLAQQARGPRVVDYGDYDTLSKQHHYTLVNRTEVDLGGATLTNIFGFQTLSWHSRNNNDDIPGPIQIIDANVYFDQQTMSNELQLKGSLFNDTVDWLVGGFYYENKPNGLQGGDFDAFFRNANIAYDYTTEKSKAVFGNVTWKMDNLVEGLALNAGVRYTWDKIRACTGVGELDEPFGVRNSTCVPDNPLLLPNTASTLFLKSDAPTWTIGLDWQATNDVFLYATSRRGYRTGGINAPKYGGTLVPFQSFAPEKVTDYEIGARTDWAFGDVSGRLNISAYIADTKNVQLGISGFLTVAGCTVGDPVFGQPPFSPDGDCIATNDPSGTLMVANAGDKRTKGIEVDGYIDPVEGLRLSASAAFLKQTTSKFSIPDAIAFYADAANGKLPLYSTPKKSGTLGLTYRLPVAEGTGDVVFNANHYWSDGVNLVTLTTKSYSLTDARLDWNDVLGSTLDASFFVKNVFNKAQIVAGSATAPSLPIATVVYNEPRMYGLQLRYRFGN